MNKPIYITTAIDYVNGEPHIGHTLEKVQADVLTRFYKQQGHPVCFTTGTDEHGTKIYETAKEQGKEVQTMVDGYTKRFQEMDDKLQVEYTYFIRTSDQEKHWPSVEKMWNALHAQGDLKKDKYVGLYCVGCEKFLQEKELVDGRCVYHDKAPQQLEEENYFFNIGKYAPEILQRIESGEFSIIPATRRNEVINIIKDSEDYVSFSRPKEKLPWGIPVPNDSEHVMYVWCDALTNYISTLDFAKNGEAFQTYWQQGQITQLIGKDIARFHTLIWPAMLLSAGVKLPDTIYIHGFISINGKRLSKSSGNIVDPFELVEKYGSDPTRYYLLKEIPAYGDGDFSHERFQEVYESDLANGIGNLFSRVTNMVAQYLDGKVDTSLVMDAHNWQRVGEFITTCEFDKALAELMVIVDDMNKLLDDHKPWQLAKSEAEHDVELLREVLSKAVLGLKMLGEYITPFMPTTGEIISKHLAVDVITKADPLFPRLEQ